MLCCSVTQSRLTLCDPMDCSTPGFLVLHHLPELAQTHVHWVGDTNQPSHPLSSPSLPVFNLSQHQVFSNESALLIRWPKYWSFSFSLLVDSVRTDLNCRTSGWWLGASFLEVCGTPHTPTPTHILELGDQDAIRYNKIMWSIVDFLVHGIIIYLTWTH